METFKEKVSRNIREATPYTIFPTFVNGTQEVVQRVYAAGIEWKKFIGPIVSYDIMDNPGLDAYEYKFQTIAPLGMATYKPRIILFPQESIIETQLSDYPWLTNKYLNGLSQQYFASFTGPTYNNESYLLPNNGFFQDGLLIVDFCETSPPGQRRGAIAFTKDGETRILTDKEKWIQKAGHFKNLRTVAGTSFVFSDIDMIDDPIFLHPDTVNHVSYLLSLTCAEGIKRVAFLASQLPVARKNMKLLIDIFANEIGAVNYRAAELEYTGASCIARSPINGVTKQITKNSTSGFLRRDHYVVKR